MADNPPLIALALFSFYLHKLILFSFLYHIHVLLLGDYRFLLQLIEYMVIMNDAPSKLPTAIHIARKTKTIANQNIIFSIGIKLVIMVLAFLGYTPLWVAVFGDVGVSILAVFNFMRVLKRVKRQV